MSGIIYLPNPLGLSSPSRDLDCCANGESLPSLEGLVAYWKMDESGSVQRDDASGNAHHLTVNGTINSGAGKINNGAVFPGTIGNFLFSNDAVFSGASPFTAFCWASITALGFNTALLGHYNPGLLQGWEILKINTNFPTLRIDGTDVSHTTPMTVGPFFLIIATISAGTGIIRVNNGVDVSLPFASLTNPAISFRVGGNNGGGEWPGVIDEVGIYNRVLTSAEKDALWNAGAGKQYPFT